jgi:hypothetical protein
VAFEGDSPGDGAAFWSRPVRRTPLACHYYAGRGVNGHHCASLFTYVNAFSHDFGQRMCSPSVCIISLGGILSRQSGQRKVRFKCLRVRSFASDQLLEHGQNV